MIIDQGVKKLKSHNLVAISNMKIFSWNIQGMDNPWTFRAPYFRIKNHNLGVIFLTETGLHYF